MTENPVVKQSKLDVAKSVVRKYERPILIGTTVVSLTAAVLMRKGIAQHNDFLREHGLFDQFYAIGETAEAAF